MPRIAESEALRLVARGQVRLIVLEGNGPLAGEPIALKAALEHAALHEPATSAAGRDTNRDDGATERFARGLVSDRRRRWTSISLATP
jgi:hypothetical protein